MRRMYSKPQLLEAVEQEAEVNGLKAFENIVDKDGHKRFIEGNITLKNTLPEGITKVYAKWALSGSHLLIVVCLSGANATVISASTEIADISVPQWILNKIYPLVSGISYVETKTEQWYGSGWNSQSHLVSLRKSSESILNVRFEAGLTLSRDSTIRIAFDLLIDNE